MEHFPVNEPNNNEPKTLQDIIAIANQEQNDKLANDKEFNEKFYFHICKLIEAFSIGILSSYPYYKGFQVPPNFEKVMNFMALKLQEEFNYEECPYVSLLKMRGVYKRLAMSCSEYVEWNNIGNHGKNTIVGVTRFDKTPIEPDFIDIDVPPRNAVNYLRSYMRETKAFDEKFEKDWVEYKKKHPEIKFRE